MMEKMVELETSSVGVREARVRSCGMVLLRRCMNTLTRFFVCLCVCVRVLVRLACVCVCVCVYLHVHVHGIPNSLSYPLPPAPCTLSPTR